MQNLSLPRFNTVIPRWEHFYIYAEVFWLCFSLSEEWVNTKREHKDLGTNKYKLINIYSMYNNQWLLMLLAEEFFWYHTEAQMY